MPHDMLSIFFKLAPSQILGRAAWLSPPYPGSSIHLGPLLNVATRGAVQKRSDGLLYRGTPAPPDAPNLTGISQHRARSTNPRAALILLPAQSLAPATKPNLSEHRSLGQGSRTAENPSPQRFRRDQDPAGKALAKRGKTNAGVVTSSGLKMGIDEKNEVWTKEDCNKGKLIQQKIPALER